MGYGEIFIYIYKSYEWSSKEVISKRKPYFLWHKCILYMMKRGLFLLRAWPLLREKNILFLLFPLLQG